MRNRPENQIEIRLTLIRHGATLSNKEGRYLGKTDEALSPEGIGMLKKAVTGGNYPTADLLFSGPMKRCLETAQILYPGQTPIFVPEWTEMDFGAFEGHNYQELSGDPAYQRWIDSGGTLPFPEGESREEFIRRNVAGYEKMLYYMKMILERSAASEQGDYNTGSEKTELERSDEIGAQDAGIQSVSAVVHGGTIMALLSHFTGGEYFDYQANADRVTAVFWYSRWEGEPRSARIFTHCQSLDCQNLQKEKHIDEISYSGIRSGIFTGSALWRSLFSAPSIRGIGWLIAKTEKTLRAGNPQGNPTEREGVERRQGKLLVVVVLLFTGMLSALILFGAYAMHPGLGVVIEAVMTYQILAARCLQVESSKVWKQLNAGSLEEARKAVSMIVGRDTEHLTEEGVAKAAIETVAENTSDGVIAPMLYTALGGPVLGFLYKAVNTMDSMVGYKNEKYLHFGRAAAKLDDVMNFLPARISALLMVGTAFISGKSYNGKQAWRIWRRDNRKHASPIPPRRNPCAQERWESSWREMPVILARS